MQPEQPNTPSTDVQTPDAAVAETSSDEQSEGSSPGWWQRLFGRTATEETSINARDAKDADSASQSLSLTAEELERKVQAETDRREAKRAADAKKAARRELREKDPWAYAEEERREEQVAESTTGVQQFFSNIGTAHDRVSIDPLVEALPQAERERILALEGAGTGLEGRKLVVTKALESLQKHWKAEGAKEAEVRLRRNPAFRKQVLNEGRTTAVEPDLLPGAASSSKSDGAVSGLLRDYYHVG
jgi:hypothetical protein